MQIKVLMTALLIAFHFLWVYPAHAAGKSDNQLAKTDQGVSVANEKPLANKPPKATCKEKEEPNQSCPGSQRAKIISCPGKLPESKCLN